MIREATLSSHETAEALRPALLRLARNLRRETEALGVTSHQVTLLWLVRSRPGLSLRERQITSVLLKPDPARFLSQKGGALRPKQKVALHRLVEQYPQQDPVKHVRYALAKQSLRKDNRPRARDLLRGLRFPESMLDEGVERLRSEAGL